MVSASLCLVNVGILSASREDENRTVVGRVALQMIAPPCSKNLKAKRLAKQNNEQDDYQNKAQTAARIVSPASAIWPCRQGGDQEQNQNYEQYGTHNFLI
jgi:hypothetical protein